MRNYFYLYSMQKSSPISEAIKKERESKGMTLKELSNETGIPISTLSKIENGLPVKNEALAKIAKGLLVSTDQLIHQTEPLLKVGVGATLMAAPILYGISENKFSKNLAIYYYEDNDMPISFTDPTPRNKIPNETSELLIAPKLISGLMKNLYDAIFVPSETYSFYEKEDVMKVSSIMNTAKGAILLLACSIHNNLENKIEEFKKEQYSESHFFYLKDTIAEKVVRNLFLKKDYKKFFFYEEEMYNLKEFISRLVEKIPGKCNQSNIVFFAGWEPHISKLKYELDNYNSKEKKESVKFHTRVIDANDFTHINEPFEHISFDCVIRTGSKEMLKSRDDFKEFFKLVRTSINKLNEIKSYKGIHPSIKNISELLLIKDENQTHEELHKMNFELQFYPEWVL